MLNVKRLKMPGDVADCASGPPRYISVSTKRGWVYGGSSCWVSPCGKWMLERVRFKVQGRIIGWNLRVVYPGGRGTSIIVGGTRHLRDVATEFVSWRLIGGGMSA